MKAFFTSLAFLALFAFLAFLYWPTLGFPFRAEHWSLLHFFVAPLGFFERLARIATFACADSNRIQPVAFFIPYLNFLALGDSALAHQLFCFALHGLCIYLIVRIFKELDIAWPAQLMGAAFFAISYTYSDILNWSFYSYVFFHAVMLLSSLLFLLRWLKTGLNRFLWLHFLALILCAWAYESGVGLFIADALAIRFFIEKPKLKIWLKALIISSIITIAPFVIHYGLQGHFDPHTNTQFHLGILVKIFSVLKQAFYNGAGFIRPAIIQKIVYAPAPPPDFTGLWSLLILAASAALSALAFWSLKEFSNPKEKQALGRTFLVYLGFALFCYLFIISFGRVWPEHYQQGAKYFEVQMRYYYIPMALASLGIFIPIGWYCGKRPKLWAAAAIPLAAIVAGNARNIAALNHQLAEPKTLLSRHYDTVAARCERDQAFHPERSRRACRIQEFFSDHYNYRIEGASESPYRAFIYNANYCETPGRTYKHGFQLPAINGQTAFSGISWNILGNASSIKIELGRFFLETRKEASAAIAHPGLKSCEKMSVSWKLRLEQGPRWDYNASTIQLGLNPSHAFQISYFTDYVEILLDGVVQRAIPVPADNSGHAYSFDLTTAEAGFTIDGKDVFRLRFPQPQNLQPTLIIGDLSREPDENSVMEISDLRIQLR